MPNRPRFELEPDRDTPLWMLPLKPQRLADLGVRTTYRQATTVGWVWLLGWCTLAIETLILLIWKTLSPANGMKDFATVALVFGLSSFAASAISTALAWGACSSIAESLLKKTTLKAWHLLPWASAGFLLFPVFVLLLVLVPSAHIPKAIVGRLGWLSLILLVLGPLTIWINAVLRCRSFKPIQIRDYCECGYDIRASRADGADHCPECGRAID